MIQTRGLTRRFGEVTAVDDVSFDVPRGMLTGFVGGNGAGKTTTMRMIMGLLGIHGGEVLWEGADHRRRPATVRVHARGARPLPQAEDPRPARLPRRALGLPPARRESAREHLERFGLADRAGDRVEKLSLGNQQRVQIIAALMDSPVALILDEPFSGLDPRAVDSMVDLLREETARSLPVLFSSHQLDLVEQLCDRWSCSPRPGGRPGRRRGAPVARARAAAAGHRPRRGLGPRHPRPHVVDVDGPVALLELTDADSDGDAVRRTLLTEGLDRGEVRELARVTTPLAEIYREVTA